MITLQTFTETGESCPKCGNNSVFEEKIYKYFGMIYSHTIKKCQMNGSCNYEEK